MITMPGSKRAALPLVDLTTMGAMPVGTRLLTARGETHVEEIGIGDRLLTRDFGFQPVRSVHHQTVSFEASDTCRPIRIAAEALGSEKPSRESFVSPWQRIVIKHLVFEQLFGMREVFVEAKNLLALPGIDHVAQLTSVTYVLLYFDLPQILFASGLQLDVGPQRANGRAVLSASETALACNLIGPQPLRQVGTGLTMH